MISVTPQRLEGREAAVSGVLDSWVRATRAFSTAGVYPVDTGIPGARLDRPSHAMLRELVQRGPRRLGDLALASNLGVSHASRLVAVLVRHGLVERTIPEDDRRVTILNATPAGHRVGKRIERQFLGLINQRMACFDEREAVEFATHFKRFADQMVVWSADAEEPGSTEEVTVDA